MSNSPTETQSSRFDDIELVAEAEPPTSSNDLPTDIGSGRRTFTRWIHQGFRASLLRSVGDPPPEPGPWEMLLIVGMTDFLITWLSRLELVGLVSFDWRSWLFGWASTGFLITGVWLSLSWGRAHAKHASATSAWFLLFSVAMFPISLISIGLNSAGAHGWLPQWWSGSLWLAWAVFAAFLLWIAAAVWRISKAVNYSTWVAVGVLACVMTVQGLDSFLLSTQPWQPDYANAGDDESGDETSTLQLSQEVFERQQVLLDESLRAIKPHEGNQRQVYGLLFAPYSQDVFLRESAMVQNVLEQQFHARGRTARFLNHPTTATQLPWATKPNLERALSAIAKAMDVERDVLVIYLTSHGGKNFTLAAYHWPLKVDALTAVALKEMLDTSGIRNRVIAVSACYSGGWVEPLQSDDTLVMTAADKDHTSYGCGSKSELTFFGRALFDEQLRKTLSFEDAFKSAVPIIAQREVDAKKSDGFSNPQISIGRNIRSVLREIAEQWPANHSRQLKD